MYWLLLLHSSFILAVENSRAAKKLLSDAFGNVAAVMELMHCQQLAAKKLHAALVNAAVEPCKKRCLTFICVCFLVVVAVDDGRKLSGKESGSTYYLVAAENIMSSGLSLSTLTTPAFQSLDLCWNIILQCWSMQNRAVHADVNSTRQIFLQTQIAIGMCLIWCQLYTDLQMQLV